MTTITSHHHSIARVEATLYLSDQPLTDWKRVVIHRNTNHWEIEKRLVLASNTLCMLGRKFQYSR